MNCREYHLVGDLKYSQVYVHAPQTHQSIVEILRNTGICRSSVCKWCYHPSLTMRHWVLWLCLCLFYAYFDVLLICLQNIYEWMNCWLHHPWSFQNHPLRAKDLQRKFTKRIPGMSGLSYHSRLKALNL